MEIVKRVSEWKVEVIPVLISKKEELQEMGYQKATTEEVWNCLQKKVWKKESEKRLHQVVQDILHLSTNQFVSYITVEAYQDEDLMASIQALSNEKESD
ncbi:post-transcriptional regulator [Halobacillus shinanisalinarum]|uniref:Post-transcriptional regulator n=1 Tax=Halobacillus shinanisalinarum TaxID=2932258 RepID=A0ABY4H0Z1_9BACI|nr:post-transcriptional regulator [Halobacillus shinanisalinarum]UOQ93843.1 post-transcriptional regulator [Halobacillus shinanisalinarum]